MDDRITLAEKLLYNYPSKALELLVDCLLDTKIRTETEQYIGQHNPSPMRLNTAFEQQPRSSRTRSHHPDFSLPQRTTRQNILDARHGLHTPSTSAGSVKSHASSLAATGLEKIYLMSCDDDGADSPVLSRSAPVKHNLIGDKAVNSRNLGAIPDPVDKLVSVPLRSGGQKWEKVTTAVNLTWRRRKEFTTNVDTFYIVSAILLDSDVILGTDGDLEHQFSSDGQEAHSPQARYQRGAFVDMEELDPAVPPHAPTVPMHSYQQTSMPPNIQRTYDRTQPFRDIQRMHAADSSAPAPHPRHIVHGQTTHTATALAASGPSSGDLVVIGLWDKTPIRMAFDPDAPGEAFYQAFYQWAKRRERDGDIERHRMTLWLKASKNTPDDEAYELELKESELEGFWKTAVNWIQENKSPEAPHLYATVKMVAG